MQIVGDTETGTGDDALMVPVDPVTDDATIAIGLDTAVETGELNESDTSIPMTLTVSNTADGAAGSIDGSTLYLQLSGDVASAGGTLTVDGHAVTVETLSAGNPLGLPAGDYYVVADVNMGDTLTMAYDPGPAGGTMSAGDLVVNAWVQNTETGSTPVTSTGTGTLAVNISNDGAVITSNAAGGNEVEAGAAADKSIELDLSATLNDSDGSEKIVSILLSDLPDGFLVYTGADAATATLASNAGGADGLNTWVISGADGSLPAYVGIMPPPHWSGTLSDLQVIVESGETALSETRVDTHDLADVTVVPVADGLTLNTTNSFGGENTVITLNLNAAMHDATDATVTDENGDPIAQDGSTETTTLELSGLGEHASFYINDADGHHIQLGASQVSYSGGENGVYTLTGLSQDDLHTLGFMQAKSALTDQDTDAAGMQIGVEAWTVESGNGEASAHVSDTITLNVSNQLATTGNDTSLIWTGSAIDGRSGTDTVHLRSGESLTGAELDSKLDHVETIDLSIGGENQITDLTPEQVKGILGPGGDLATGLTIQGSADDNVALSGDWTTTDGGTTWTGTIDNGDGTTSSVTLTVNGAGVDDAGVTTLGVDGFAPLADTSGAEGASFAPMALSLDFDNAQTDGGANESAFLFDHDGSLPTFDSVLAPTPSSGDGSAGAGAGSTDSWLSGQESDSGTLPQPGTEAPSGGDAPAYTPFVPDVQQPDDDLQHSLASAHAVG